MTLRALSRNGPSPMPGPVARDVVVGGLAVQRSRASRAGRARGPAVLELEQRVALVAGDRQAELGADAQQRQHGDLGVAGEPLARDILRRTAGALGQPRDDLREAALAAERVVLDEHLDGAHVGLGGGGPAVLAQLHGEAGDRHAVARDGEVGGVLQEREVRRDLARGGGLSANSRAAATAPSSSAIGVRRISSVMCACRLKLSCHGQSPL